jgi:putative transposase
MSELQSGVKFRAYPSDELVKVLRRWIGCQRFIYNGKVGEDALFAGQRRLCIAAGDTDVKTPLDQAYSQFKDKELSPWLYDVPSQLLRNGAVRWMAAKQRQLKGLSKAPRRRNRRNFNSVLITSELFRFLPDAQGELHLELGTDKAPIGVLPFKAHRPYKLPNSLVIREIGGRWFVSFSYADAPADGDELLREPHELAYELDRLDDGELDRVTRGLDRNVRDNCFATSEGKQYALDPKVVERIRRKEVGARRYQRRIARCQKGSNNRRKLGAKLARKKNFAVCARLDFTHKTTHELVTSDAQFFVLEDLKIRNMTRKPKARLDEATGRYLPNGARAKAALNAGILSSCWGELDRQLGYKAARRNKLVGKVPAAFSSQECSQDGHIHPDNRNGSRFVCQRCGFEAHADHNAGLNIKARGIARLRAGDYAEKKARKRVTFRKKKPTGGLPASNGANASLVVDACGADVRPAEHLTVLRGQIAMNQETLDREAQKHRPLGR